MIPLLQNFRTVVLANGAFPEHPLPLSMLRTADRIICCDGATEHLLHFGRTPDFIVGDLDSISADLRRQFAGILIHITEQETNDLTKSVHFCIAHGWRELTILGATGKREDHTLGNISLLADYAEKTAVQMLTDHGVFTPQLTPQATYESHAGQQVSLCAFDPTTLFSTKNLVYPLDNRAFTSWWQGTLNEAVAGNFTVEISAGKALIFREYLNLD